MTGPRRKGPRRPAAAPNRATLRVVSGTAGGRRLDAPAGDTTRPTPDRVREAVFNALDSLGAIDDAVVLDAFAGSGALGIEALSRGAARVTFAETDPAARAVVEANLTATGLADRARVIPVDGIRELAAGGPWDLVLLDPPYAFDRWAPVLETAAARLAPDGVVVVESDREPPVPPGLTVLRSKAYGSTLVTFLTSTGAER